MCEFKMREIEINAVLSTQKRQPWVLQLELLQFGLDTHGALGKEAQTVIQQIAEKRVEVTHVSIPV